MEADIKSTLSENPMVSIQMITYNHEDYIAKAIEGVLMQKTSFSIELVIGEDCSTDSTREICEKYAKIYQEIIRLLPSESNLGMSQNGLRTLHACQGKYIALLDGDDYWTDPLKLQKQVDFLESNPQYSICGHRFQLFWEKSKLFEEYNFENLFSQNQTGIHMNIDSYFKNWYFHLLTVVFRKDCLDLAFLSKLKFICDDNLFYSLLKKGDGYLFGFVGGVYRRHDGGIFTSLNPCQNLKIHYEMYKDLYFLEKTDIIKKIYLINSYKYLIEYIQHNEKLNLILILTLIKEQIKLDFSFKLIIKILVRVMQGTIIRISKSWK